MTPRTVVSALVLLAAGLLVLGGCKIAGTDGPVPDPPCGNLVGYSQNNPGGAAHAGDVRFLACVPSEYQEEDTAEPIPHPPSDASGAHATAQRYRSSS